ncbi:alpha-galactosidase [Salipaludibacillus sp. HK11]|uniref:alpha-galactosidase n=1 Tax=Salipaludibacillus sp. HK11 TaxID=3394320 RepID=UPI0039FC6E03
MIYVNESKMEFHLQNESISYIFHVMKNGQLGQLYYGKRISQKDSFASLIQVNSPTPNTAHPYLEDPAFSLETRLQEFPSYGTTDFRDPALELETENGATISNFVYSSFEIHKGKKKINGLPATYAADHEAETLEIRLWDRLLEAELKLTYTLFADLPVLTRSASITNHRLEALKLNRLMSLSFDLPTSDYEFLHLSGAWARERNLKKRKLEQGIQAISSVRGSSSHAQNPFAVLKKEETTEFSGEVIGFSLVYSSNFLAQVEVDHYGTTRFLLGIHPFQFSWELQKGDTFDTPEAIIVFSDHGLNGMSQVFHTLYREHLVRKTNTAKPVMINNWEATYFDFDEEKLFEIASASQQLGVELFVLDDGWFGKRNSDKTSLGDWFVNRDKFPQGLDTLAAKIQKLGMQFGLWFEPEMISKKSELMTEHPDWVIQTPDRTSSFGRNQFVLDFSKQEVVDYLYQKIDTIIKSTKLSYIKWDMNRNITEAYSNSLPVHRQGEFFHRYILGVYQLLERLTNAHPTILIETCAGGGGRFDSGMLYYSHQAWTSDNTDAIDRLSIQYGTSLLYPIETMGSHVSAVPNHQTYRTVPLSTRANTAFFGTFGYELDPLKLSEEDREIIKNQIKFFKKHRSLLHGGTFIRLMNPTTNQAAWMVRNGDGSAAIVGYYNILAGANPAQAKKLRIPSLNPNEAYKIVSFEPDGEVDEKHERLMGDELMNSGLALKLRFNGVNAEMAETAGDFHSEVYYLTSLLEE